LIVYTSPIIEQASGDPFYVCLLSDLHIGSMSCSIERIKEDLERAKKLNARISINGDIFDFILPSDKKRFRLSAVPERLYKAGDNITGAAIKWAEEVLGPYAPLIDVIGVGNHDDTASKHHGNDMVTELVVRLNEKHGGNIRYGGYCGWLHYRFQLQGRTERRGFKIQYHHGSGGSGPVSKGMPGFQRAAAWIEGADCIWRGHKHHKTVDRNVVQYLSDSGKVHHKDRLFVMSASYLFTYEQQDAVNALETGRRANYAADWDVAPQAHGGVFLRLDIENNKGVHAMAEI